MADEPKRDMAYYEKQGSPSDWRRLMDAWVEGIQDPALNQIHDYKGFNMIHEVWKPRVKWFRPPMWKIFRWAYNIKRVLYTGCYPRMAPTEEIGRPHEPHAIFEFTAKQYDHPTIDAMAEQRMKDIGNLLDQNKEEDK